MAKKKTTKKEEKKRIINAALLQLETNNLITFLTKTRGLSDMDSMLVAEQLIYIMKTAGAIHCVKE